MYFTPRGKDLREFKILDFATAQKFLEISVSGKNIIDFFKQAGIKSIALAPYNHFGQCVARMLKDQDIEIKCFMDKLYFKYGSYGGLPVTGYENFAANEVDAVVITSNYHGNAIIDTLLENKVPIEKIIGINTILYGMERMQ